MDNDQNGDGKGVEQVTEPAAEPQEEAAAEAPILGARTLMGDLRDFVLGEIREQREPWHKLSESQQRYVAQRVEDRCRGIVVDAVNLIAACEFAAIPATLKEAKIKDGIEGKVVLSRYDEHRHELLDAAGSEVIVLLADAKQLAGGARSRPGATKAARMNAETVAIVDEQIAFWRSHGTTSCEAARALGCDMPWAASWRDIRDFMMQWQLRQDRPLKLGCLPSSRRLAA